MTVKWDRPCYKCGSYHCNGDCEYKGTEMNYEAGMKEQAAMHQSTGQVWGNDPYAKQNLYADKIKGNPIDRGQAPQLMQVLAVHEKMLANLHDSLGQLGERLAPLTPQTLGAESEGTTAGIQTRPKSEIVCKIESLTQLVQRMECRVRMQLEVMDL